MSEGKTPRTLDQVLASWPEPERKEIDWTPEKAPSSRFADVTDDELLGPPLAGGGGEASGGAATAAPSSARKKDRGKELQELAKLAEMTPAPDPAKEKEENSGVVHLAALAASEGQNIDGTPLQSAAPAVPSAPTTPATAQRPAASGSNRPSWLVVSGLVAAAAVVALVFGMKRGESESPVQVTVVAPPPVTVAAATATPTAAAAPRASQAAVDQAVDPSTLPPADMGGGAHPSPGAMVAAASPARPGPASPTNAASAAASATTDTAVADKAKAPTPAGSVDLQEAMQQAAGPQSTFSGTPTATAEAPAAAPTSVTLKPSQGAINGALGAALPGARACLGPDDPISRATVTFQSDGTVQSVTVTGGAAGKPAEACIRSALMRAKVPPFAMPTFTAPATIRPN
jgi:hypothetical protein